MLTGMAKPMPTLPPERERIALLIPTTSPDMLTRGPPELPGLMAASVCRKSSKGPWPIERPLALMMPAVTVCWRPKGEPMASTQSPTLSLSESPSVAEGKVPPPWRRSTARSVRLSTPATLALYFLPSAVVASISLARSTTWAFVSTVPDGSTITPDPRLRAGSGRSGVSPPKKRRKNSSPKNSSIGVRPAPRVTVLMLTTAGPTLSATWEKLPDGTGSAAGTTAPCTPAGRGGRAVGLARSTAPAPQAPRPAPATSATRIMKATVLRFTRTISSSSDLTAGEELAEAIALQRLPLLEFGGRDHQHRLPGAHEIPYPVVDLVDDGARLVVDGERRLVAELPIGGEAGAFQEHGLRAPAEGHGTELLRHAVLRDHQPRHLGGALEVIVSARRDLSIDDFLGHAPAQQHRDAVLELALGEEIPILEG